MQKQKTRSNQKESAISIARYVQRHSVIDLLKKANPNIIFEKITQRHTERIFKGLINPEQFLSFSDILFKERFLQSKKALLIVRKKVSAIELVDFSVSRGEKLLYNSFYKSPKEFLHVTFSDDFNLSGMLSPSSNFDYRSFLCDIDFYKACKIITKDQFSLIFHTGYLSGFNYFDSYIRQELEAYLISDKNEVYLKL